MGSGVLPQALISPRGAKWTCHCSAGNRASFGFRWSDASMSEVLPPITSATETPGLISIQSASDLNLRVLESTTQTSELLGAPRQERSGDPFLTRSLWQWQAGPAGTTSQYLVGTCCWPWPSRAPASYDTVGNGVSFLNLLFGFLFLLILTKQWLGKTSGLTFSFIWGVCVCSYLIPQEVQHQWELNQ